MKKASKQMLFLIALLFSTSIFADIVPVSCSPHCSSYLTLHNTSDFTILTIYSMYYIEGDTVEGLSDITTNKKSISAIMSIEDSYYSYYLYQHRVEIRNDNNETLGTYMCTYDVSKYPTNSLDYSGLTTFAYNPDNQEVTEYTKFNGNTYSAECLPID